MTFEYEPVDNCVYLQCLLQSAYSAGMLDSAQLVESGVTANELQRIAEDKSQAYALSATGGTL